MKNETFNRVILAILAGAVLSLSAYIFISDKEDKSKLINEAKTIALTASASASANTLINKIQDGKYELLEAKLDWIISALRKNGIYGNLPIPTPESIVSKI